MRIELIWKYIHYDVDQLTWRYGKSHNTDEENKEVSQTSVANESDANLVKRLAVTGTARLRRILKDYITAKVEDADDTLPTEKTKWGFNFNAEVQADGHALAELMHWFVVRFCMWQWCKMFAPDQATLEEAELKSVEKDLKRIANDSGMPMKEALVTPDSEWNESVVFSYVPEGAPGTTE